MERGSSSHLTIDIGKPVDAKFFIKSCHQRGIRVVLDVVMNMFAPKCPLALLAPQWFYEPGSAGRQDWGQDLFLFDTPSYDNYFAAREFLCEMAEFWVSDYHVDGFRIDDFADINNWDFVQEFHDRATAREPGAFPRETVHRRRRRLGSPVCDHRGRSFQSRRAQGGGRNLELRLPGRNPPPRDERDKHHIGDEPSRSVRVQHLISNEGIWNDWNQAFDPGYADMACSVDYITSHDVADGPRLMNIILGPMLQAAGLGDGGVQNVRGAVDGADTSSNPTLQASVQAALRRVFGAFAILMTSVGMPMWLAGEEFGDVHDTDYIDVNAKQQDPVQWNRAAFLGNAALKANVAKLIQLRTSHPALQRNEVEFFYFHPQFDDNDAPRVFAYCRSGGQPWALPGR